jgi:hypothetical protein
VEKEGKEKGEKMKTFGGGEAVRRLLMKSKVKPQLSTTTINQIEQSRQSSQLYLLKKQMTQAVMKAEDKQ